MIKRLITTLLILTFCTSVFAHEPSVSADYLGKIHFPISANQAAQSYFEKGVLLLHSFEYEAARNYFQKAEKLSPGAAMPYWGEAMSYNHPLWQEQDINAARKVLTKFATTPAERERKANTAKEKGFMHAINLLYGAGEKSARDCAYNDAMRELYRHFPNDDEVASFYALALLATTQGERDFRVYMQAAGIVEEIFARNPSHPGAVHYAIHSYDDPIHAPLGLRAARIYAKIAPSAAHALHMPSHIFLTLGMWDDVIASNQAAWNASVNQHANMHAGVVHGIHALQWLSYGYLQKQQYKVAYQQVKAMEKIATSNGAPMAKWYYAIMRAAYMSESQDWHADLKAIDMTGIELSARASDVYTNVMRMLNTHHDDASIHAAIEALVKLCRSIPTEVVTPMSHPDYYTSVTSSGIATGKLVVLELRAQVKLRQGDSKQAIDILRQATLLEDQLSFGYGPPIPVKPAHELLAEVLLQDKQYVAAYAEYVKALKRAPNRTIAMQGLTMAADKIKQQHMTIPEKIMPYFHKLMMSNVLQGM